MKSISARGWLVVGACLAISAAFAIAPKVNAQTETPGRLSVETLGTSLSSLGLKPTKDQQRFDFSFKAKYDDQDWELTMSAVMSTNGDSLWIMAWLDELPTAADDVPKTALLGLLANNDRMGKGKFFAYIPANRRFVLERVVENRDLTPRALAEILRDLGGSVAETFPYWAAENWTKSKLPIGSALRDSKYGGGTRQ